MVQIEDGKTSTKFICDHCKKNIFLIGDSIRLGYCEVVREQLLELAEVFYVSENCRNTQYVITNMNTWANMFDAPERVDIVQFNCGHWDTAHWCDGEKPLTSEMEYKRNIKIIIDMIRKLFPNAKIVFATTTTMNPNGIMGVNYRTNAEISRYNELATEVVLENGVEINDIHAVTKAWDSSYYDDYCHFTPQANKVLGEIVANALKCKCERYCDFVRRYD